MQLLIVCVVITVARVYDSGQVIIKVVGPFETIALMVVKKIRRKAKLFIKCDHTQIIIVQKDFHSKFTNLIFEEFQ